MKPLEETVKNSLNVIAYSSNNIPNAVFVWDVIDTKEKMLSNMYYDFKKKYSPDLPDYSFFSVDIFYHYCTRGLRDVVTSDTILCYDTFARKQIERRIWGLKEEYSFLKEIVGSILYQSATLSEDPGDFLGNLRRGHKFDSPLNRFLIFLALLDGTQTPKDLESIIPTTHKSIKHHLDKMSDMGYCSIPNNFSAMFKESKLSLYNWNTKKSIDDISYEQTKGNKNLSIRAINLIGEQLIRVKGPLRFQELARLLPYNNKKYLSHNLTELVRQKLVQKISKSADAPATLTERGKKIAKEILQPVYLALTGDKDAKQTILSNQPTKEQIVALMAMHDSKLHG